MDTERMKRVLERVYGPAAPTEEKKTPNIIIGIYGRSLTKNGEYRALVGVDLL